MHMLNQDYNVCVEYVQCIVHYIHKFSFLQTIFIARDHVSAIKTILFEPI